MPSKLARLRLAGLVLDALVLGACRPMYFRAMNALTPDVADCLPRFDVQEKFFAIN